MTAHALSRPHFAVSALRQLDLIVLAIALPVFLVAGFPLAGYAAAAGVWLVQRAIKALVERRVQATDDPRTSVGLAAASMLARGWMSALVVLGIGLIMGDATGLAAAILVIVLFTIHFTLMIGLRPLDQAAKGPR